MDAGLAQNTHALEGKIVEFQPELGVHSSGKHGKTGFVVWIANLEDWLAIVPLEAADSVSETLCGLQLVSNLSSVSNHTKAQKLVGLDVNTGRGATKVESHAAGNSAQVRDFNLDMFRQALAVAKNDPSGTTGRFPELMPTRGNAQDVFQTKVPSRDVVLKRSNETTRGGIDMETYLETLLFVDSPQELVHFPNGIIGSVVVISEDTYDHYGHFVDQISQFLGVDAELLKFWIQKLWFDIKVSKCLFPTCLIVGGDHNVGDHADDLVVRQSVTFRIPLAPLSANGFANIQISNRPVVSHHRCMKTTKHLVFFFEDDHTYTEFMC